MKITVFEQPLIVGETNKRITIPKADFIKLKPILDMCRVHKKTLMIIFNGAKEEE